MSSGYEADRYEVLVSRWRRTHDNDEETRVVSVDVGSSTSSGGTFLVVAVDLDVQGDVLATEIIDSTITSDEAERTAERWIEQNPKGINGNTGAGGLLG